MAESARPRRSRSDGALGRGGEAQLSDEANLPSTSDLRAGITACVAVCRAIDVRAFEARGPDVVRDALVPAVHDAARDALGICRQAAERFEDPALDGETMDAAPTPSSTGASLSAIAIADIAFIGTTEIRPLLGRIEQAAQLPRDERLELCSRALRRVVKVLAALDAALASATHESPVVLLDDELRRSIATRRHYARVRRVISGYPVPSDAAEAKRALERVRLHFALLIGSDVHAFLRLTDRQQIDELQTRIVDTIKRGPTAADLPDAMRLWQDLVGFARLVVAINRRQELVENDTQVVTEAHATLAAASEIPTRLRARLDMLAGCDDAVDALLDAGDWSVASWRPVLHDLYERLVRPSTGRFRIVTDDGAPRSSLA